LSTTDNSYFWIPITLIFPYFVGVGGCLNIEGDVVLDAGIQRGSDLEAGCVALVKNVRNPISLARKVLDGTPHTFIAGEGATKIAERFVIPISNEFHRYV
jgi:L-asparaginase / beta-aspartyl-peptidase